MFIKKGSDPLFPDPLFPTPYSPAETLYVFALVPRLCLGTGSGGSAASARPKAAELRRDVP